MCSLIYWLVDGGLSMPTAGPTTLSYFHTSHTYSLVCGLTKCSNGDINSAATPLTISTTHQQSGSDQTHHSTQQPNISKPQTIMKWIKSETPCPSKSTQPFPTHKTKQNGPKKEISPSPLPPQLSSAPRQTNR